jgi:hypothetical protein
MTRNIVSILTGAILFTFTYSALANDDCPGAVPSAGQPCPAPFQSSNVSTNPPPKIVPFSGGIKLAADFLPNFPLRAYCGCATGPGDAVATLSNVKTHTHMPKHKSDGSDAPSKKLLGDTYAQFLPGNAVLWIYNFGSWGANKYLPYSCSNGFWMITVSSSSGKYTDAGPHVVSCTDEGPWTTSSNHKVKSISQKGHKHKSRQHS